MYYYCFNSFNYKDYLEHNKIECLQNNFWKYIKYFKKRNNKEDFIGKGNNNFKTRNRKFKRIKKINIKLEIKFKSQI